MYENIRNEKNCVLVSEANSEKEEIDSVVESVFEELYEKLDFF